MKNLGLSDEEKENARLTLGRAARGIHEHKLQMKDLEPALELISVETPEGERQLKERLTDDAGVPDEPFEIDIGQSFKQAVDRALAK